MGLALVGGQLYFGKIALHRSAEGLLLKPMKDYAGVIAF